MKLNLFMFFFLKKLIFWLSYLQTRIKKSYMYLSCQFFEISHETVKLQQILLPLQTKNSKHDRMEELLTDIHRKKCLSTIYKLYFCSQKDCRKCIFRSTGDLNFKTFSLAVYPRDISWRQWTKQIVKKLNLCGKTVVDKVLG